MLDTWFSSGLWPLTTLGWPDREDDLSRFYPTSLMETGYDILFFWVARMMMFGLHFREEVPFRQVFLHSMVLGEDGQKMSKTRGNVVDPVGLIESHGADALRFYLATMAGQDAGIVFSQARVEGYRNFCNKLWNAARFIQMNLEGYDPEGYRRDVLQAADWARLSPADRWILARSLEVAREVGELLHAFRLDLAAHKVYQFVWYELCDWYLELAKVTLRGEDTAARAATQGTLATVLDVTLRVLHPIIPFITEEIWTHLPRPAGDPPSLMIADYPRVTEGEGDAMRMAGPVTHAGALATDASVREASAAVELMREVVTAARALRAQFRLPPAQPVRLLVRTSDATQRTHLAAFDAEIRHLARLSGLELLGPEADVPRQAGTEVVRGAEVVLPLEGLVDLAAERARVEKELAKLGKTLEGLRRKLANPNFRAKAPAAVVAKDEARVVELETDETRLRATLARLEQ